MALWYKLELELLRGVGMSILDAKMPGTVDKTPTPISSKQGMIRVFALLSCIGGRTVGAIFICLFCIYLYPETCLAQQPGEAYEYEAKAALIYNFAKFTTWPEETFQDAEAPFVFAVLGNNPFGDASAAGRRKRHGRTHPYRTRLWLGIT
jgi:hypothetical protein